MHGNLTLEQNGHFSWALMAAVGPWMEWVGPMEAMILCTRCSRMRASIYSPLLVRIHIVCLGALSYLT